MKDSQLYGTEAINIRPKNINSSTSFNKVELIKGGHEFFSLLIKLIENAKENIHLQTYIYDDDETGILVGQALMNAVKRGVSVYLLADGYASQVMSKQFINELKEAGIQFRYFEPLYKSKHFYFGRRMHHKVFVADSRYTLVGGINISNRYNDMPGQAAWLDYALYAEGEIAKELCVLCWKAWYSFPRRMGLTQCEKMKVTYTSLENPVSKVRMRRNDWVRRKNEISGTFIELFSKARSHIVIICSYFLPGRVLRRLLTNAAARGVKIKIITAGFSDIKITKPAERWLYDWMLRNKVELYEYQAGILHAKAATCDSEWMTIGSYNLNNLSTYASIELNLDVFDSGFTTHVEEILTEIIKNDCVKIVRENHQKQKNVFKQILRWFAYEFIRLVFFLVTFYYRQEKAR